LVDRIDLQSAVDQLPDGYRQIFILYDVLGFDHTEIAEMLGCSIGNSKSQLHKARKRLRELLQRAKRYGRAENHGAAKHSPVLVASY
jgi:RNA polymerase sigma-70 factor, ECF subfamily